MAKLLNVSSSPHVRSKITTGRVMLDVILALMPATFFGVYRFGLHALMIILVAVATSVVTELLFDLATKRPITVMDGSAFLTGLLLALSLSPTVPWFIPFIGSIFAVLVVKCFFGGLGQNFMNPALAGRCFALISFSALMTNFGIDGISSATPLAVMAGGGTVNVTDMFFGFTTGTIGISCFTLLLGAIYLLLCGDINWEIPVAYIASFLIIMLLLGGQGFNLTFLAAHLCGGGIFLGAFYMATDPVTSPVTRPGHLVYGSFIGVLTALFRIYGSFTDSVSYAIILGNLLTPLIDKYVIPKPFGLGDNKKVRKPAIPKAAAILMAITLIAGIALGGVNLLTRDIIEQHRIEANAASYKVVLPEAENFSLSDAGSAFIKEYGKEVYGNGTYGRVYINEAFEGMKGGEVIGYALNVSTMDGFDGEITISIGIAKDGTITGISFTEINETPGMGMRCAEPEWMAQFAGVNTDSFVLLKSGGSSQPGEIDSVSGASISSGAVVNAVNAAIDFVNNHLR